LQSIMSQRIPFKEEPFSGTDLCRTYDEHAKSFMMPVYHDFVSMIVKRKTRGERILDIGTGSGLLAIEIAKVFNTAHVTGIDMSEDILKIAQRNVEISGLSHQIEFKVLSAAATSFPDGSFDIIVSNASLHHWFDPQAVFSEIKRITVNGGFCLIRDNMRLSPLFNPLIKMISFIKGMNEIQHDLWVKAIQASYTISELNAVLKNSDLKNSRVSINPTFLDLTVTCSF
jgi:ubiquinone/menaquinone biosynthesis C-methylase UbiE